MFDAAEYEELFPEDVLFDQWVAASEKNLASIRVQLGRDRFLFDQDDLQDQFSPYNTCNS